jgi:hypothetical protein
MTREAPEAEWWHIHQAVRVWGRAALQFFPASKAQGCFARGLRVYGVRCAGGYIVSSKMKR